MKIQDLLNHENKWTRYTLARDSNGKPCKPTSFFAVKWSLVGAIYCCYPTFSVEKNVRNAIKRWLRLKDEGLQQWNEEHSFVEVRKLVEALDI